MRNVFIVNTPFQLYVVRRIINQYYDSQDNCIISTIEGKKYQDVINISHSLNEIPKIKNILNEIRERIHEEAFFVPHLGNLFASYVFELSSKYKRPISVFYEGTALFYDPIVSDRKSVIKRSLMGILLGIRYKHYRKLYPKELLKKAICCYSPVVTKSLNKFSGIKTVDLFVKSDVTNNNNILLLSSDIANIREIDSCIEEIKAVVNNSKQILYFKPHYVLNEESVNLFISKAQSIDRVELVLLDKQYPIEELFKNISFKYIICQCFTSAIINMSFMYGNSLVYKVINKETIPVKVVNELGINIL